MPEFPLCSKCGYRHAVPRFEQVQPGRANPCDREPRLLGDALDNVYDRLEAQARD